MPKSMKIKKGDTVKVITGKDEGKQGKVIRAEPKKLRLFVEHLNMVKCHQRPRSVKDTQKGGMIGGVIEKEGPIHISNVMLVEPKSGLPSRVGVVHKDGKRMRVTRRSKEELD